MRLLVELADHIRDLGCHRGALSQNLRVAARRVTLHAVQRREQLLERLRKQNLLEARIAARPSDVIVRNQIHGRYAGAIVPTILARKGC